MDRFVKQFEGMLKAGIPREAALESLLVEEEDPERREELRRIANEPAAPAATCAPGPGPGRALDLLRRAWESRASDVHLDPDAEGGRVRFRLDGVLVVQERLDASDFRHLVDQLKTLGCLELTERELPQDGRLRMRVDEEPALLDVRVGIDPCVFGEAATLRLSRMDSVRELVMSPESLFPEPDVRAAILEAARRPYGLFVITGPVDSGKTTTGYSLLQQQDRDASKVVTVEDPVEMHLAGVHQMQVKPAVGLTITASLRGMMRRDPDVIYCAEVRDVDTAWLLSRAALTGHLVITTLHAPTAAAAVARLVDIGVERYVLADSLIGVLAQRLVRVLCLRCRRPDPEGAVRLRAHGGASAAGTVFEAAGCPECHGTGYLGRRALHELLPMTPELRRAMHETADRSAMLRCLEGARVSSLRAHGLDLVARGITTLAEIDRVLPPE